MKFKEVLHKTSSEKIEAFCAKYHIRSLAFFGSILTSKFKKNSDLDILISFDPEYVPNLLSFVKIEAELTDLMGNRVDLRTANDLSPYFREEVIRQAEVFYGK